MTMATETGVGHDRTDITVETDCRLGNRHGSDCTKREAHTDSHTLILALAAVSMLVLSLLDNEDPMQETVSSAKAQQDSLCWTLTRALSALLFEVLPAD